MAEQLSLLDMMHAPPVLCAVDPDGGVVQAEPDIVLRLAHPRLAWDAARIELHRHTDGLWMWSTSACVGGGGWCYRVGAKWGKFAETEADARHYAVHEMKDRLQLHTGTDMPRILAWLETLA